MIDINEWIGKWWNPDTPDKTCCGVLKYDPLEGNELKLFPDKPVHSRSNNQYKIFHGSSSGQKISLMKCNKYYKAEIALFGNKHLTEDELKFKYYEVYISHLKNWASSRIEEQSANIDENLTILLLNEGSIRKFKFCYSVDTSYSEFRKDLLHLTNYISLAVAEGCYFEEILAYNDASNTFEIKEKRYFGAKDAKNVAPGILFNLKDIETEIGFEVAIKNWFIKEKELLSSYSGLYFVSQYSKNLLEFEFLSLAQALDYLTNYWIENKAKIDPPIKNYLPPTEFEELKKDIISKVKSTKHKEFIEESLRNDIIFSKRINILLTDYQKTLKIKDKKNFISYFIATRNSISHGTHLFSKGKNVKRGYDLLNLFNCVKMVLTCVMMDIVGFNKTFISKKLKGYWAFEKFFKDDFKF